MELIIRILVRQEDIVHVNEKWMKRWLAVVKVGKIILMFFPERSANSNLQPCGCAMSTSKQCYKILYVPSSFLDRENLD